MIRKYLEKFLLLDDLSICRVAFMNEALRSRMTNSEMLCYYNQAVEEGRGFARSIRSTSRKPSEISTLIALHGGIVTEILEPPDEQYALFAYFQEPNIITINRTAADCSETLIVQHCLSDLLGTAAVADVLLCHEWYHMLVSKDNNAFSQKRHLPFLGAGRFVFKRRIACLEEIAAMSFSREILELPISPYAFNILILYAFYPAQAEKVLLDYLRCGEVI